MVIPALKKSIPLLALFFAVLTYSSVVSSSEPVLVETAPEKHYSVKGEAPSLSTNTFAIFDVASGEVLLASHEEDVVPIASVTKLITAATLLTDHNLESIGTVTAADLDTEGRAGKLEVGDDYVYRELLFPLLLESSNDAAAFFERETNGEVITNMNRLVKTIGMSDTTLVDASGLSDKNVSSAADLMHFLSYVYVNKQHLLDISRLEHFVGSYTGWVNNSPVITASYRGGKHGYTEAAGRTLVALFEEQFGESTGIIGYVLLGSENIAADTALLRGFVAQSVVFE